VVQRAESLTSEERDEVRPLRRQMRQLRYERAFLSEAADCLRGRPPRARPRIRVRDRPPGRPSRDHYVPGAGGLSERILRATQATPGRADVR